jgi:hypothetical protein
MEIKENKMHMITEIGAAQHAVALSMAEVVKRLAPAVLANLQTNADHIAWYLQKNNLAWNVDNIQSAIWALHQNGRMLWDVDPVELSGREKALAQAKAQEARQRRDYQNSIKDRSPVEVAKKNAEDAAEAKKIAEAKELANIKSQIFREIDSYQVGHPSGRGYDYTRQDAGKKKLNEAAGNYLAIVSVTEANRVLENVKVVKYRLP